MMKEKFYTVKEVADYLRLGENSVYKYVQRKILPATKLLGSIRISEKDLNEFMKNGRTIKAKG